MADKKITDATLVSDLTNETKVFINQNGALKQVKLSDLQSFFIKPAITLYTSSTQTLSTSFSKIFFNAELQNISDNFIMYDGSIQVNRNCYIELSANISVYGLVAGDEITLQVWRDNYNFATVAYDKAGSTVTQVSVPSFVMYAPAGSVISIYGKSSAERGSIANYMVNRLTVKEV